MGKVYLYNGDVVSGTQADELIAAGRELAVVDVYTIADWRNDGDFSAAPGDLVTNDVVLFMFDGAAPMFDRDGIFQCSTPRDLHNGRPTFPTFRRERDLWRYIGYCHAGQKRLPDDNLHH